MSNNTKTNEGGARNLILKEDWWAVWIGLGIVLLGLIAYLAAGNFAILKPFAVSFKSFSSWVEVPGNLVPILPNLAFLYIALVAILSAATAAMRRNVLQFVAGFTLLFVMAIVVQILGGWKVLQTVNLEAPVVALIVGIILGNFVKIPAWFEAGMKTEFYVKTGIVLFGATMPFTLILQAGPMALLQATVVAVTTFVVIYFAATKLFKLEKPFAATLGAGGSICGVSASIAIGSSVNAKKNHVSIAISMVVIWATIMVFLLPIVARAIGLSDGAAGALIGTSEFADAAGVAAAAQFGDAGNTTFVLMKVVGRDIFVGIWALILAIISVTLWERHKAKDSDGSDGAVQKPSAGVIWGRFPKFVLGFFIASIIVTLVILAMPGVEKGLTSDVLGGVKTLRGWMFVLCFLCIGLTTRFRDLAATGWKPFAAFTIGVIVNVALGLLFSVFLLNGYWTEIGNAAVAVAGNGGIGGLADVGNTTMALFGIGV